MSKALVPWRAYGCLALSMALVGSYVALSKPLVAALPVFLLAWTRFGIGGVAMLNWLPKPAAELPMDRKTKWLVFLESLLGNFLFTVCMLFGVSLTSAVSAGVIMASIPTVVALLSWLFLKERITNRVWAAIACAAGGVLLLVGSGAPAGAPTAGAHEANPLLGNALVFAAVVCEAAYAVIGKSLTGTLGPKRISALINLWGLVLMTPFGLYAALRFDFSTIGARNALSLVFYALAASVWTVWLWMTGLQQVPASRAGVFTVMLPVSAALVGVLVLGESMGASQVGAFTLALGGVLLATWPERGSEANPA